MVTGLDIKTALVLIDLQKGLKNYPFTTPLEEVTTNASKLVSAFRKAGLPIVAVNVNPANFVLNKLRKDAKQQPAGNLPEDWLELLPDLGIEEGDIKITKASWSAFANPDMHCILQDKGITGIVLAGVSVSIGVEGTARSAAEKGYNITFATDAMSDTSAEAQQHSLERIFPRIGELGTTDEIIAKLIV